MKHIIKLLFLSAITFTIWSCKKDENKIYYEGGTAPVLSSTVANNGTIPLSFVNKDNEAIKFTWTNPEYKFTTGISSQNVSYVLEIDTVGANFTNPRKQTISIGGDLSKTFTQLDFNTLLYGLQLKPALPHTLEVRVISSINGTVKLTSNIFKFTATPFVIPPKIAPPASGKLFIVGNATAGGWNNPVPVPTQELTQVTPTFYTVTLPLIGGNFYLLLPVNGDWGAKYGAIGGNGSNNPIEDEFKPGGGDLVAPSASGNYKIEVDFQTGKFKLTKL